MRNFLLYAVMSAAAIVCLSSPLMAQCTDGDSDGYYYEEGCGTPRDCNDADPDINPGALEICNGFDDNCDSSLDEGCHTSCFYPKKEGPDIRETDDSDVSEYPSLVWTGSEYGVSWADGRDNPKSNKEIYFARLDSLGNKLGSDMRVSNNSDISEYPSLVWTGSEFGISWTDLRHGDEEIYFARLDSSGNLIGSEVRITYDSSISEYPSLVWTGKEYGVAWSDFRDGNTEIYFARLDSSGNKIGSDIRVTHDSDSSYHLSLVWNGSEFGVSWRDRRDGAYEIYFAQLDSSGSKIGSDVRITEKASISDFPSLVWTGSEFGISWEDNRDGPYEIYFARLDSLGNKISSDIRVTNNDSISDYPSLAWNGSEFGVSWEDDRNGNYEIYFARLDSSGNKVSSDIRMTDNSSKSFNPSLVWNGIKYGVSWDDDRDLADKGEIYFARIECCDPDVDSDFDTYSECEDCNDNDDEIYVGAPELCDGKDNDCDGTIDEDLSTDADEDGHYTFDSCWTPNDDCDDNNPDAYPGAGEILCNDVDENCDGTDNESPDNDCDGYDACGSGDVINPDGLEGDCNDGNPSINPGATEICDGYDNNCDGSLDEGCDTICDHPNKWGADVNVTDTSSFLDAPSLVWTGNEYGVSWKSYQDANYEIYFARLDSSGNKIGSNTRVTNDDSGSSDPSLSWTGSEYGVSWNDNRDGNDEIYFTRLNSSGSKIGSDIRVTNDDSGSYDPSLVWTGDEYGLCWHDYRDGNYEIYFARIDLSGNKLGADVRLTNDDSGSSRPSLVWTGSEYGVSWNDDRDGNWEIYFARFDLSGNKLGSDIRITHDSEWSEYPSLVWTGLEYGVSWHDNRDGNYEIYFARMDASGNKIGLDLRVTDDIDDSFYPSLSWTGTEYGISWNDNRDGSDEIYFARIDSSGSKIGADVRITSNTLSSQYPSLVWTGNEYGVSWYDSDFVGNGDIYFVRIRCCDDAIDADFDTYSECDDCDDNDADIYPGASQICDGKNNDCDDPNWPNLNGTNEYDDDSDTYTECSGDCDDNDASVYPGAPELCDTKDNDCDGTIDEPPPEATGLIFDNNKSTMNWDEEFQADRYDIVKGNLISLRSSGGDFTSSLSNCLEDDSLNTQTGDSIDPDPGKGFYYLIRCQCDCLSGTYNTEEAGQVEDRDSEIEESLNKCP